MLIDREAIQQAKEQLGDRNADLMQEILQMEKYNPQRKLGCCPNPDHDDHNPSCSYDPKRHLFHCFSCGYTIDLVSAYMLSGMSFTDACRKLFAEAGYQYDFSEIDRHVKQRDYRYPKPKYAKNRDKVNAYWRGRGISEKTLDYVDIQEDPDGNTLFQYYDLTDTLVTVKVRSHNTKDAGHRFWHLKDSDHMDILFNMNRINPEQPLIITCGEGDCMTAVECGFYNAVSINGGEKNHNWIANCWEWLQQFHEIILVPDNDDTGKQWLKTVRTRLGEYRIKVADVGITVTPIGQDPKEINDLNELYCTCGREAVQLVINEAKDSEIPSIVDYADVKKFDMSEVAGVTTGIADMDEALDKFYMGSTTVLTGTAGSGKTSLLSTLICKAVEQDFPVFVYSGELSNPSLKSWIDYVHAGRRGLNQYEKTVGHGFYYRVRNDVAKKINKFYKGKIFFYKDSFDQKVSHIMQTAESVVRKYGVRFLVFDNLTSMDLENDDNNKYQKQEEFIRNIVSFATQWDVCCVVVLHPKKMDMYRKMSIFDLQGVSAAVNLTHRVLALYRVRPEEKKGKMMKSKGGWVQEPIPYDVTIEVLKDRFGSGAGKTIGLYYDVPSKRFYDTLDTLDHKYQWDAASDYKGVPLPYETPSLVEAKNYDLEVLGPHQPQ
nr:MAG TPA: DNA directed DNA polymerase [Caudoviricetes sp.]